MRGVRAVACGLVVALSAGSVSARPAEPPGAGEMYGDNLGEYADQRAAEGAHADAAEFYFRAYDRVLVDPVSRRNVALLHEPLEKGVVSAAEAWRADTSRTDLLCEADRRLVRHASFLADVELLSTEAVAVIRGTRSRLNARLLVADAVCPGVEADAPPSIRLLAAGQAGSYPKGHVQESRLIEPGALDRATAVGVALRPRERPPGFDRPLLWTRLGTALMAGGILVVGLGVGLAARERDASAALTIVTGATAFTAGFPMLIIGDKRRRAAAASLAMAPGRLSVSF